MPKDTYTEMVFKEFFGLAKSRLQAVESSFKDAELPEPPQPRKRRVPVAPVQQATPFTGGQ